jgi:hypothetical protein
MKDIERPRRLPPGEALPTDWRVTVPAKHHRGGELNQSIDAIGHTRRRMDSDDRSQAGPDEDHWSGGDGNDGIANWSSIRVSVKVEKSGSLKSGQ